jgi:AraC-like DNA-binding protein
LSAGIALLTGDALDVCQGAGMLCTRQFDLLYWLGAMAGAGALLALFFSPGIFPSLKAAKGGRERYWLSLALAAANVLVVGTALIRSYGGIGVPDADALMLLYGFAFAYLATTALFRVYPLPVPMSDKPRGSAPELSPADAALAKRITALMQHDKLYQEPAFSRADLTRELGTSESILSRVINTAFGKSFPRLLNELRVQDAQVLLRDPALPIQMVASESGFNSLASFNRVFRDLTGETPSAFRAKTSAEA